MATTLKAIRATIRPDGTWDSETPCPLTGPTEVIITVAVDEEKIPNETTQAAMDETLDGQPRFSSVEALLSDLES